MVSKTSPATRAYTMIVVVTVVAAVLIASIGLYLVLLYQDRATFDLAIIGGIGALILGMANQISILFVGKSQGYTESKVNKFNGTVEKKVDVAVEATQENSALLLAIKKAQSTAKDIQHIAKQQAVIDANQVAYFSERLDKLERMLEEALIPKREDK